MAKGDGSGTGQHKNYMYMKMATSYGNGHWTMGNMTRRNNDDEDDERLQMTLVGESKCIRPMTNGEK